MADWIPSLNALRAFEAVARHLSYRKAADELRVTPAAVKQLVSKLESAVGAPLVRRKGRGLELTARGERGQDDLSAAMSLLGESVRKFRTPSSENRLFVSVEASFASAWLVPKLQGFRVRHPEVTVLIDSNQSIVDLGQGEIDVAIRYGVDSPGDLVAHRLFEDEIFPVCSPALAPALKTLADLAHVPLIHWDITQLPWAVATRRWFTWETWLNAVGASHLMTKQGLIFSEYGQAIQAAIAGQGVMLASWPILRELVDSGVLVAPFSERVTTDIGYELVTAPETMARPEVAAFVAWVLETAQVS
ncbi:LysR substrate-binding domain-containing protein [Roseovarius sp. 2305UL8-3]|uniref:LysR substrate-binding domain-containing protein n=1 Tax=Roseovarius conchicola TaxID=3121636 RepID=UPI003529303C